VNMQTVVFTLFQTCDSQPCCSAPNNTFQCGALAAVFAVMGALAPDEASDRIADLWAVISDYWSPGKDD